MCLSNPNIQNHPYRVHEQCWMVFIFIIKFILYDEKYDEFKTLFLIDISTTVKNL